MELVFLAGNLLFESLVLLHAVLDPAVNAGVRDLRSKEADLTKTCYSLSVLQDVQAGSQDELDEG